MRIVSLSFAALFALGVAGGCQTTTSTTPTGDSGMKSPDAKTKDPGAVPTTKTPDPKSSSGMQSAPDVKTSAPMSPDAKTKNPLTVTAGVAPAMTPMMGPAYKDASHTLKQDAEYFLASPSEGKRPDGMWKAGTPVLVTTPSMPYSKVKTGDGTDAYVMTSSLSPK